MAVTPLMRYYFNKLVAKFSLNAEHAITCIAMNWSSDSKVEKSHFIQVIGE